MLSRLRIRQKLAVLLAVPLTAVALVMTAFTVDRVVQARAYAATAEAALAARDVGALIQTLQQERLLALGYLVLPTLDRSAVVSQGQLAMASVAQLAASPRTAGIIEQAQRHLDALRRIRPSVVDRTVTPRGAYTAYQVAISALMESLDLARLPVVDVEVQREMLALDVLMQSNEDASRIGAIVVATASDLSFDAAELRSVIESDASNLNRFRQLVDPAQAALVATVEEGAAAQRLGAHVATVTRGGRLASQAEVSEALTAALTYTGLRRLAQDRVARDLALAAQRDASVATTTAAAVAIGATVLFLGVVGLAVTVGRSIAQPLRRLSRAVGAVAELSRAELVRVADSESLDARPPELASVEVDSDDEIGDLAAAVNRVQATAAMLLERQATARANIATMFANVSRRTQNLVGRQLQMIDELSRQEQDAAARERLSQLEHVTARLRRSADSLLVISGTVDPQLTTMPSRLAAVIDKALAEIEDFKRVDIKLPLPNVAIGAELVPDLRLLLSELLENATNFTPPGSPIEVSAVHDRGASFASDAVITIVDHGLGMSPARMEEENRRLVERERLDVTPTRVLGLFVVGRLARRHGLTVRLEPTPGRGVTATVRIPARWLTPATAPSGPAGLGVVPPLAAAAIESAARSGPFPWLSARSEAAPVSAAPVSATAVGPASGAAKPAPAGALGEVRRRSVAPNSSAAPTTLPASGTPPAPATPPAVVPSQAERVREARRIVRDPEAERASIDAFVSGLARAERRNGSEPTTDPHLTPTGHTLEDTSADPIPIEQVESTLAERHQ